MESMGLGAGLAALAFWGFVAAVVLGGIWYSIRIKESQQETIRRIIESGQVIDQALAERLLSSGADGSRTLARDLRISALCVLPTAVGLALFAFVLGSQYPEAFSPMLGASLLLVCIGVGLWLASRAANNWQEIGED